MIVYSEIPNFGQCYDGQGFYRGQKTGIINPEAEFIKEGKITNLWKDPINEHLIGQVMDPFGVIDDDF